MKTFQREAADSQCFIFKFEHFQAQKWTSFKCFYQDFILVMLEKAQKKHVKTVTGH